MKYLLSSAVFALAVVLFTPITTHACTLINDGNQPDGWGAAHNVFSRAGELILKADCTSGGFTPVVGSALTGPDNFAVYSTGYYYDGTAWQELTYEAGPDAERAGPWILGDATAAAPLDYLESANTFFAAYTCHWRGSPDGWQCGCQDASCDTPAWQLQAVPDPNQPQGPGQGPGYQSDGNPPLSPVPGLQRLLYYFDFTQPGWRIERAGNASRNKIISPDGQTLFNISIEGGASAEFREGVGLVQTTGNNQKSQVNIHSSFFGRYDHVTVSPPFYCEIINDHKYNSTSNGGGWWFYSADRPVMNNNRSAFYEPDNSEHGGKRDQWGGDGLNGPWHRTSNAFHLHIAKDQGFAGKGSWGAADVQPHHWDDSFVDVKFMRGQNVFTAWGEAIYKDGSGDIIREKHVLDANTREPLDARPRGGGAIYPAQFRDNLSEMAKTRWKWKVKEPQYNPLALNRTPLQALEFGYNDRLGIN